MERLHLAAVAVATPKMPTAPTIDPVKKPDETPLRWRDWVVRLWNDPFNKFEHVVESLVKHVPGMSDDMAWSVAWQAHREGVAATYQGPREVAELVAEKLSREGLIADCCES